MELWIFNQDKMELVKVEEIRICEDADKTVHIWGDGINRNLTYHLGMYKTKERALEVLNEIRKVISTYNTENGNYVYEMPLDYEDIEFDMLKALNTDLDDDVEMG